MGRWAEGSTVQAILLEVWPLQFASFDTQRPTGLHTRSHTQAAGNALCNASWRPIQMIVILLQNLLSSSPKTIAAFCEALQLTATRPLASPKGRWRPVPASPLRAELLLIQIFSSQPAPNGDAPARVRPRVLSGVPNGVHSRPLSLMQWLSYSGWRRGWRGEIGHQKAGGRKENRGKRALLVREAVAKSVNINLSSPAC